MLGLVKYVDMAHDESRFVAFRSGNQSIADLLSKYRPYLRLLAERRLDQAVGARLSASDVVQQTHLEAFRDCGLFRGDTEEQFVAWLKRILANNISQATQTHMARKRSVKRDRALPPQGAISGEGRATETPSRQAIKGESYQLLCRGLQQLPRDQCSAIRLRYLHGLPLAEIASRLQRSESAAAGLLKRGLRNLRRLLSEEAKP